VKIGLQFCKKVPAGVCRLPFTDFVKKKKNGKRQTANGKRQTANGERQTANGKQQTANGQFRKHHIISG